MMFLKKLKYLYKIFEFLMDENNCYQPSKRVLKMVKSQGILKCIFSGNRVWVHRYYLQYRLAKNITSQESR